MKDSEKTASGGSGFSGQDAGGISAVETIGDAMMLNGWSFFQGKGQRRLLNEVIAVENKQMQH